MLTYLTPASCALLVVDIQEVLLRVICQRDQVIKNAGLLLRAANTLNIPVIATTQYAARIGQFPPELNTLLPNPPLDKMEFGCFNNQKISAAITSLGPKINTLIVGGIETHICVYQTVLGGLMAGYKMLIPTDAVSSRSAGNSASGLARIREMGGQVLNTEMIIYELLQRAGTPQFKELLPFLK
ncbi:MAG: isochorismatase family protein [Deltaproteobacteria bacterium]|nr:isochorismatase family protein [Deltaproteobacteria bacterium]